MEIALIFRIGVFMISGVLLLNAKEEPLVVFFRKRLAKVVIPLLIWTFIYILIRKYGKHEDINILFSLIKSLIIPQFIHLWFLYTIIGMYLFLPILKIFINNSNTEVQIYFLLLWVISVALVPLISRYIGYELPNHIPMMAGVMGYFVLGYRLSKIEISKKLVYISIFLFTIGTLITIFDTAYLTEKMGIFTSYFYGYLTLSTILQATSGFIILKYIGEKLENNQSKLNLIIYNISYTSLGIYLIHPIMLSILYKIGLSEANGNNNPLFMVPLIVVLAFIMSFSVVKAMQKIPLIKYSVP